jgi:hypothetical protein
MEREFIVRCGRRHMLIASGNGFVRFKIPWNESHLFLHCQFHGGDCWEGHLKESPPCRDQRRVFRGLRSVGGEELGDEVGFSFVGSN